MVQRVCTGLPWLPKCTIDPSAEGGRSTLCTAPLLPFNLTSPGLLAYDGTVHMQDDYFIDYETQSHSMSPWCSPQRSA